MVISRPTLVVWKARALKNIKMMYDKSKLSNVTFRPHFKTHQSGEIGAWYRSFGVTKITVSSVEMAEFFANKGWDDITISFPVNILEIETINKLASTITLNLLVESKESVEFLAKNLSNEINIWLKIDVGYHRTGINPDNISEIIEIIKIIQDSTHLRFSGLLTHAGHTYDAKSLAEIHSIYETSTKILNQLKTTLTTELGLNDIQLSYGDTPSCSVLESFPGIDEIRPGNFVYYDVMQMHIGSCSEDKIAVAVACPVVAKHKSRMELVIYGGGVHFSKEQITIDGTTFYGYLVEKTDNGWGPISKDNYLSSISQEHGVITVTDQHFDSINVGNIVYILPVHSCMSADLLKQNTVIIAT